MRRDDEVYASYIAVPKSHFLEMLLPRSLITRY